MASEDDVRRSALSLPGAVERPSYGGRPSWRAEPRMFAWLRDQPEALVAWVESVVEKRGGPDVVVAPLEGLWWADDPAAFTTRAKDTWHWTMLISQPDWITEPMIDAAKHTALAQKQLPAIGKVHRLALHEDECAQALHIGSYDAEGPLLEELHGAYLADNGLDYAGRHHEIYLSDPRRTEPAKLKTILRQPVRPARKE